MHARQNETNNHLPGYLSSTVIFFRAQPQVPLYSRQEIHVSKAREELRDKEMTDSSLMIL